ncbi:MAG: nucleotidyltransferase domain-containing protein [Candidatus Aenigmatarchaeota archaeon]
MDKSVLEFLNENSVELVRKYPLIKAIFVYGSAARKDAKPNDVDTLVIVDDTSDKYSPSMMGHLEDDLGRISKQGDEKLGVDLHFQSPKTLSVWWDLLRSGEPWVTTAVGDALVIYDPSDYITPLSILVNNGRVHGTREKAETLIERAPYRLKEARRMMLEEVTTELLAAMVETAQAVLMFYGIAPPAAKSLGTELKKSFVDSYLLDPRIVEYYEDFFEFTEKISHGEVTKISGREIKKYLERGVFFITKVDELFGLLEVNKKKEIIDSSYDRAVRVCADALHVKKFDRAAIRRFKREFVDTGMVSKGYLSVLERIFNLKDLSEKGKIKEIPERDIYSSVIYAKNLEEVVRKSRH